MYFMQKNPIHADYIQLELVTFAPVEYYFYAIYESDFEKNRL